MKATMMVLRKLINDQWQRTKAVTADPYQQVGITANSSAELLLRMEADVFQHDLEPSGRARNGNLQVYFPPEKRHISNTEAMTMFMFLFGWKGALRHAELIIKEFRAKKSIVIVQRPPSLSGTASCDFPSYLRRRIR